MTHGVSPWDGVVKAAAKALPLVSVMAACIAVIISPVWKKAWDALKWVGRRLNPNHRVHVKLSKIEELLIYSDGSSLLDKLNKIEGQVNRISSRQDLSTAQILALLKTAKGLWWVSSPDGKQLWASTALIVMSGWPAEALKGLGWVNILEDAERLPLIAAWEEAQKNGYIFDRRCNFISRIGKRYHGRLTAYPIDTDDADSVWLGEVTEIVELRASSETRHLIGVESINDRR